MVSIQIRRGRDEAHVAGKATFTTRRRYCRQVTRRAGHARIPFSFLLSSPPSSPPLPPPNWAVNVGGKFIRPRRRTAARDARRGGARSVPRRGLSRKLRNCCRATISVAAEAYRATSVASRQKIAAPRQRILWPRRRKRAAKITAKTSPRGLLYARTAASASTLSGERVIARLFRKSAGTPLPLPAVYWARLALRLFSRFSLVR